MFRPIAGRSIRIQIPPQFSRGPSVGRPPIILRVIHPQPHFHRSLLSFNDVQSKSFRRQLYDSPASRTATQKVEEAQIANFQRTNRTSGGGFAGLFVVISAALAFYYLGTLSSPVVSASSTTSLNNLAPPKHNLTKANLEAAWADFVNLLGKDHVSTQNSVLEGYTTPDWSSYFSNTRPLPFLILYPSTTEEVSEIAKICHHRKLPITPFSGGTSCEGNFTPTQDGIVIDFSRMNKILTLHEKDMDVVVQPGVGWQELNEYLKPFRLFFPPDPGPGAMIGGMIGTGCSGTNATKYGTMKDWVLGLTVVLADGTIIKTRQRPRKSSAGYDLTKLFVGSEGTLGLVTEATLKLEVKPFYETVAVASFNTISEATDVVEKVVRQGIEVAAVELLDDVQIRCINLAGMVSRVFREAPTLFFKFAGTKSSVKEQVAIVKNIIQNSSKTAAFEFAKCDEEAEEMWQARKNVLWSVMALKSTYYSPNSELADSSTGQIPKHITSQRNPEMERIWVTDVAVPVSRLSTIVEATKRDLDQWSKAGFGVGTIVGHVGDGNFHCILSFREEDRKRVEEIVHRMVRRAIEMEGTVTGEHGVGLVKRDYLKEELGESAVDTMRKLKLALDPLCLLNCDKVLRMEVEKRWPKGTDF